MSDSASTAPTPKDRVWLDALTRVAASLDGDRIAYFLDTGTLLGAVRDGAFIPWDNDIDIGILDCPYHDPRLNAAIDALVAEGFVANRSPTGVGFFSPAGVEVNLKLYEDDGDGLIGDYSHHTHPSRLWNFLYNVASGEHVSSHGGRLSYRVKSLLIAMRPLWRLLTLPWLSSRMTHKKLVSRVRKTSLLPLGIIRFYDTDFRAPGDCRTYLSDRYGASWETPVRDYDYTRDDQSIAGNRS
ncbi:LicD family protein [Sphingopyxis microcysteis]|uniref:LicD family protein n=1 Tax=Sphingopyxis microcysteis TaxID=2484145 RepID=UPI001447BFD1|nr:LicD family protein [Sphingopyxis microcysteis]